MAAAHILRKSKSDVDMTEGNIVRHIVSFAFPLLIGNIFQQLYNTVDTWVVGNYVSNEAFSAVGTVGPVALAHRAILAARPHRRSRKQLSGGFPL